MISGNYSSFQLQRIKLWGFKQKRILKKSLIIILKMTKSMEFKNWDLC